MGALDKLNRLISLYGFGLKGLLKPVIWLPFLLYFMLQAVLLVLLNNYPNQYIYPILSPLMKVFGADQEQYFTHYPGLYIMLPFMFQMSKLIIGVIFEGLALGLTSLLFIRKFRLNDMPISIALNQWIHLSLAWTVIMAILFAIGWYTPQFFESLLFGSPRRALIFDIGLRAVTVAVYSLFIFAVPAVVVYRLNFITAIKKSLTIFLNMPIFSFFLALIAYLVSAFIPFLLFFKDTIVAKFSPELVFYILLVSLFVDFLINIVFTGVLTKFLCEEE